MRGEHVDEVVEAVASALADADASAAVRTLHRVEEVALVGAALPAAPRRAARLQRALQCAARVRLARARHEHCAVLRHDQLVPATSHSDSEITIARLQLQNKILSVM